MMMMRPVIVLAMCLLPCLAWDSDDLELFDLVEEVNANFYEFFGIDQSASTSEIRKAYRKMSLQHHPDKNDAEDAAEKFRQVVAVYEVLKDKEKREKYNLVLVEGLPDWRQPVFYYRRAVKMGLAELALVLVVIVTVGQYFVMWAIYIERRLVLEEVLSSKNKKKDKKKKKSQAAADSCGDDDEELNSIPTPRLLGLWPFQLSVFLVYAIYNLPTTVRDWREERRWMKEMQEEEERQRALELEEAAAEGAQQRKPKKKAPAELPEYSQEMYASLQKTSGHGDSNAEFTEKTSPSQQMRKGEWTDEELVNLSKAVNKFPGGTPKRWEKIADMIGRSVADVTARAKATKGGYSVNVSRAVQNSGFIAESSGLVKDEIISQTDAVARDFEVSDKVNSTLKKRTITIPKQSNANASGESTKSNSEKNKPPTSVSQTAVADAAVWTQNQQTIFEWALKQYPKITEKRWDKVAEHIPGKTKEDCMARFKVLADLIRKKKMESENKSS